MKWYTLDMVAEGIRYRDGCLARQTKSVVIGNVEIVMEIKNQSIVITGYPLSNTDPVEPGNTTPNLIESRSRNYRL